MYRDSKIDQWELIISKDHIFMLNINYFCYINYWINKLLYFHTNLTILNDRHWDVLIYL